MSLVKLSYYGNLKIQISPCNDKGKTSSKKNDNVANPLAESNMKKLEN